MSKDSNASSAKLPEWVVRSGIGADSLHIGQTEQEVLTVLGSPESTTRKYEDQYYLNYPTQGLEIDLKEHGGRIKYLYFFRSGVRGNNGARVVTSKGIRPGDTRQRVLDLLGDPDEKGSPVDLNSGTHFGEWFRYANGINFQFGKDDRVDMITITEAS